jgi:hypothetical protein
MRCCGGEADVLQTKLQILQLANCKMHHNGLAMHRKAIAYGV